MMKQILIDYMKKYTSLSETELKNIVENIPIAIYEKGRVIFNQGEVPTRCYFVLKGCVRQYTVDESGKEVTVNFFTEEQSVTLFNSDDTSGVSRYSLECLEETVLVIGDLKTESDYYGEYSELETMTRNIMVEDLTHMQENFTDFMSSSPEIRYLKLLEKRPGLAERVPQNQLASYLGITPESLSRIKKRINKS